MNNIGKKLAAVALTLSAYVAPASAGKGGSAGLVQAAINSGSQDAIIAEVEKTESLMCEDCVQMITNLTEDSRYEVREVAAWWFAKRPGLMSMLAQSMATDLASGSSVKVRNAADFLGATLQFGALPKMTAAISTGVTSDAKLAIVRAVRFMAHPDGNAALLAGMRDADPVVRAASVSAWREILGQTTATAVEPSLADGSAKVRAEAASAVGALGDAAARPVLEQLVVGDADATVRRNAAWALGKIGSAQSRTALLAATHDKSGLVNGVAKAALTLLKYCLLYTSDAADE